MIKSAKSCLSVALGILILWIPSNAVNTHGHPTADAPVSYRPAAGAGNIPMFFEENVGQTDDRVRFIGRGRDYSVLIADNEAVFNLPSADSGGRGSSVRMQWAQDPNEVRVVASLPLSGKSNYLVGNDPTEWKTDIPTYGMVQCEEVSSGVDLKFYAKGDLLEYDLIVKPGADPETVRLTFSGTEHATVDSATGELVLGVAGGELRHGKPVVHQPMMSGKQSIEASFTVLASGEIGFDLGSYDVTQPLVIDPVVTFVQFVGGALSEDFVGGAGSDGAGAIYVAGRTQSVDFAPLASALDGTHNGNVDAFVVKLDPLAGTVVFSTYIGSPGSDSATEIDVDAQGLAYVAGITSSPAFPTTEGAYRRTIAGDTDGFVCKLSADGSSLVYSTFFGGISSDSPGGIAVDAAGQVFVVGQTNSSDFPTLPGAFDRVFEGTSDCFALKLNAAGSDLVQATFLGGGGPEVAGGADVTSSGDLVVTGRTQSPDFPVTPGAFDTTYESTVNEGFVTRLSSALSAQSYSTFFGGLGDDSPNAVSVDPLDRVVFAGSSASVNLPVTPGAPQPSFGGGGDPDGFVCRLSVDGTAVEFCTYIGAADIDTCTSVRTDTNGAIFVAGFTKSTGFPTTAGALDRTLSGSTDAFVAKYLETGAQSYATFLGGDAIDEASGLALTSGGRVAVAGQTRSSNFPVTSSLTGRPPDGAECFAAVLSADGATVTFSGLFGGVSGSGSSTVDAAYSVLSSTDGSVYLAGSTQSVNFPVTPGGFDVDRGDALNGFVLHADASGRNLISATVFGGIGTENVRDFAAASNGDLILVGGTRSPDFPTTAGAYDLVHGGISADDAFVLRISSDGSQIVFGTYLGGSAHDDARAVVVDGSNGIYVAGTTSSPEFPVASGAFDSTFAAPGSEAFVLKLGASGAALDYSTFLGGSVSESGLAIAVDGQGEAVVAGQTSSADFPVTAGAFSTSNQGGQDVYVTKLNATGTGATFSTYLGASGSEQPGGIALDASGNVVVSGATNSTLFPTTPGAFDTTFNGGFVDGYVSALNAAGSQLVFSTFIGGNGDDVLFDLALDSAGNLWACGSANSTDIPFPSNSYDTTHAGQQDALVLSLDATGSMLRYASYIGGLQYDVFFDLSVGPGDAVTLGGQTGSAELTAQGFGYLDSTEILFVRLVQSADTVGLYVPTTGAWFPRFANASGPASLVFSYGAGGSGLVPLAGNWDGTGGDSPGLYDPSTGAFFLRNSSSPGPADIVFTFGPGGSDFVPLAGDWNGDGTDTIGIYSLTSGAFFLRNANAGGPADLVFTFGPGGAGFTPVVGDWNGDGTETIGIYQTASGAFFLRNANASGGADLVFTFGSGGAGVVPVTGDWNGDGTDTIGVVLQSSGFFFLRDSNSAGPANYAFGYGAGGETPVVGNWAG